MNERSDFEGRLATAFSAYADQAPVEVDVVTMSATVARRTTRRWWSLRTSPRTRLVLVGILAVLAIGAAIVAGSYLLRPPSPVAPVELQSSWRSVGTRPVPGAVGQAVSDIFIGPTTITIPAFLVDVVSAATFSESGRMDLRITSTSVDDATPGQQLYRMDWHCPVGDEGTYTFALSADGQDLTVTPVSDACAPRAAILQGDWVHSELAAGRHVAGIFQPFGDAGGRFSYAVPVGWQSAVEDAKGLLIATFDTTPSATIQLFSQVVPQWVAAPCADIDDPERVGTAPDEIARWLTTFPRFAVTAPTPITVGGLGGVMVDVSVRHDTMFDDCGFIEDEFGGSVTLADPGVYTGLGVTVPSNGIRLILLDRGDRRTMAIVIGTDEPTTSEALRTETQGIIDSFEFVR